MPRHLRLRLAGVPFHVIQRGNNRGRCFSSDAERSLYLALLAELAPRFECAVHAYVLMTNHVHLLMTPGATAGTSSLMKHVGQRYAQYINRTHGRTGSLWEGRFRSCIVDSDGYLLRCCRYIECNPVRAGMAGDPAEYPWSSYRANAMGESNALVTPHPSYLALGETDAQRRAGYLRMFESRMTPAELTRIREATNGGFVLGRAEFVAEVERMSGRVARRKEIRIVPRCGTGGLTPVRPGRPSREAPRDRASAGSRRAGSGSG